MYFIHCTYLLIHFDWIGYYYYYATNMISTMPLVLAECWIEIKKTDIQSYSEMMCKWTDMIACNQKKTTMSNWQVKLCLITFYSFESNLSTVCDNVLAYTDCTKNLLLFCCIFSRIFVHLFSLAEWFTTNCWTFKWKKKNLIKEIHFDAYGERNHADDWIIKIININKSWHHEHTYWIYTHTHLYI